ncbi:MAG: hypothetical protein LLF28_00320 [Nitrospiraceae bacterium]|nr:hypothetical protein [Nitrospiraceae bacterium]
MDEQIAIGVDFSLASKDAIEALLAEVDDDNLFEEILNANRKRPEILFLLVEHPSAPQNIKEEAAKQLQIPVNVSSESQTAGEDSMRSDSILQRIHSLNISEKRMLAMRGGREARSILLKDPNKQIMLAVIENPKISESEIEILAHQRSIPDELLRAIMKNREWMKKYEILLAVITNPKTPAGVAIPMLTSLKLKDLSIIEKNRNISDALRTAAKKLAQARKPH